MGASENMILAIFSTPLLSSYKPVVIKYSSVLQIIVKPRASLPPPPGVNRKIRCEGSSSEEDDNDEAPPWAPAIKQTPKRPASKKDTAALTPVKFAARQGEQEREVEEDQRLS
ncbi:uncharacterized protein FOMMEDRAFT_157947 [Fomitiporia mediterranea MF3/22]|uniref:uncharacterized protein n=1 Tax=Fomitiporia mediterranea (strain MF3/22) TaxID=694068 RepID=UPI0004408084|nr:uncharacterized protein FOMMEDRAFT_157946 [Fomitiporia mediterranea MF3/22]XP_007268115.1 uncharacterized protein FOMMEDRAFT_157947 [Fomitiporia mediterranea MF3/22]EJD00837.1 hypothetical protein FOMMEDRAFT_157946 [Fomitiporia mediterranea MF3/22]EJD00838.1 hypothetical protein FOMMEDRAFT_157947 [Fomitiporia mediterranea MF3/22]